MILPPIILDLFKRLAFLSQTIKASTQKHRFSSRRRSTTWTLLRFNFFRKHFIFWFFRWRLFSVTYRTVSKGCAPLRCFLFLRYWNNVLCYRITNSWLNLAVLINFSCLFVDRRVKFLIFWFDWSLWGLSFNHVHMEFKVSEVFLKLTSDSLIIIGIIKKSFLWMGFHWNRMIGKFIIWLKVYRFVEYLGSLRANNVWRFVSLRFNLTNPGLFEVI